MKTQKPPKLHALIYDMSSNEYHSTAGTYSSSQFKDCLDDEEVFFKKHIEKSIEKEENAAFDVGNYFHVGSLESHKLKDECIVFPGKIRRGKDWDRFKIKHKAKTIITQGQLRQAEMLIASVKGSPVAMSYISQGKPEVSLFVEIAVYAGEIYATHGNLILTKEGWKEHSGKIPAKAVRFIVKVRADNIGPGFVLDLKSTSGNAKSEKQMRDKVSAYNYDLSASLYLDIFNILDGEDRDFIWTFASKEIPDNCQSWKASPKNILVGRAKWRRAVLKIADGISSKWAFGDILKILDPRYDELEHINEKEIDLL